MKQGEILLVEDDEEMRIATALALELAGFAVRSLENAEEALHRVGFGFNGIVVSDIRMPGMDGMTLMARIRDLDPDIPVILVTGHGDVQLAVRAIREGAYDFVEKPFSNTDLSDISARAMDRRRLVLENRILRAAAGHPDDLEQRLTGRSSAMIDLRHKLRAVGPTDADVLIVGDVGVGKEVAARALHDLSGRAGKPFVAINCAALPSGLIESELFGHEAGAFPGALRARFGKFELARGGTILLDDIGAMPVDVQAKLLRVFEERAITRLGTSEAFPLDVRFIATSKVDLEDEVVAGRFMAELLYRLNVITLRIPALSQRAEDIPMLFLKLVGEAAARYRREPVDVSPQVLAAVAERDWRGNVRELRNAADRFGLGLGLSSETGPVVAENSSASLSERMAAAEKAIIANALAAHGGRVKPVYESLGLSRKALYMKMRRHGLERRGFVDDGSSEA
ncbi:two-component system, NtrC family, C4-dicarboxylate transport response regulator DctD [Devosia lucknowensis]|uniref:Two-component system, NtrC family, C4-dicarboxylate transport response regulator DctD n=1 Tax=Devosia lucknowensis TaxID=1096929 RepID=A0A1Y6G5K6_9HYPH|nr:sigma-54 dependent transcriptional regulator [Devosia lucknowensis]SMQ85452.1 two-component system, NtrC family, C4-dicarboxylate transport response regulator DctD [Devosia lucknowensis]